VAQLGKRIIDGLQEAIDGDFSSVLIDGRIWVRKDAHQALREAAEAALDYLDREEFPHKSAKGNDRLPVAKKLKEALAALDCPQDHRISPEQGQKQRSSRARCESCSHFSAFLNCWDGSCKELSIVVDARNKRCEFFAEKSQGETPPAS
jgi:hypothetical protein